MAKKTTKIKMNDTSSTEPTKKLGRFFVPTAMYFHHGDNIAETLAYIKFLPVRVEHRADMDAFELTGISKQFDDVVYGAVVPMYELQIRSTDDGKEYVKCVRKTEE